MTAVGVDWGSGYWVAVQVGSGSPSVRAHPSILDVWAKYGESARRILVDMPIGIPDADTSSEALEEGWRKCDRRAKDQLPSALASSVFRVPCREAVEARDYETAVTANRRVLDSGLGSQSWCLAPRIMEVDTLLKNEELGVNAAECTLRESHPELCFTRLVDRAGAGHDVTHRKSSCDGERERVDVLSCYDDELVGRYECLKEQLNSGEQYAGWKHRITKTRLDDVLDAMALAVVADMDDDELQSLPRDTLVDDRSNELMEIVCPKPSRRV